MAQQKYSIDLQDTRFPLLSEQQTRTIIGSTVGKSPAQQERPRLAYCHNVMPSLYGLDAIGYLDQIPAAPLPAGNTLLDIRIIYSSEMSRAYIAWDNVGNIYILEQDSTVWIALPATSPVTTKPSFNPETVTVGTVNGVSYVFYAGIGAFTYNETSKQMDAVTLTGLNIIDVLGVTASSGYLVAYTAEAIAWSSTIDPIDFVPSEVTGAGGGNVAGIAGNILFATSNTLGILVYSVANTIALTFTGNTQFPFKAREVESSRGGISLDLAAYEDNSSFQYVFSKAGLQRINSQRAEVILPEVTDFIAGRRFEDFNEITKQYEITDITPTQTMRKKVKLVSARYLVISYGLPTNSVFSHALVYDLALNKLGKLRIDHVDAFEFIGSQTEISKDNLSFLLADGQVRSVDFSSTAAASGVVILGKLQASHTRVMQLLGVEVENIETASALEVNSLATFDGKNITPVTSTLAYSASNIREYVFKYTAVNHSLLFLGKFNLTTVLVRYAVGGRR